MRRGFFGAGVLRRLQSRQRGLARPVVKIANQSAFRADLPRLRQVVLPRKALKDLSEQARQLSSDFFDDDFGSDCLRGASLIQS
ncbi:hypothetical protein CTATCC11996_10438 [Comamonas testosteroni ATCC 11996]|nr:hypothetical protein CTATCC11996_10438 [Comamonas testosteroni ATCC 11996]